MSKKDEQDYKLRSERNKDKHKESREGDEKAQNRRGFLIVLVVLFAILIFLLYLIFSGGAESDQSSNLDTGSDPISIEVQEDSNTSEDTDTSEEPDTSDTDTEEEEETADDEDNESDSEEPANPIEEQNADNNLEEVEPNEDAIAAYEGDWEPIGTEQSGSHVTNYSDGSQDRLEIKEAVSNVTGLDYDTMIEHWIGNDGTENGVEATVSDRQQTQFYRANLIWNDGQGWQVQSVEILE